MLPPPMLSSCLRILPPPILSKLLGAWRRMFPPPIESKCRRILPPPIESNSLLDAPNDQILDIRYTIAHPSFEYLLSLLSETKRKKTKLIDLIHLHYIPTIQGRRDDFEIDWAQYRYPMGPLFYKNWVGCHLSSRLRATLNLCPIYLKLLVHG